MHILRTIVAAIRMQMPWNALVICDPNGDEWAIRAPTLGKVLHNYLSVESAMATTARSRSSSPSSSPEFPNPLN
jgi:hypothetical protein